jgi:hypothetical protein
MNAAAAAVVVAVLALHVMAGEPSWVEATRTKGIVIYNRDHPGGDVKEVMAVGTFDYAPAAVHKILDDLGHYKDFMPYAKESHELEVAPDHVITYERIAAPLSSERDYTIRVTDAVDDKGVITHSFKIANDKGPKPIDGVVRIEILEGHWVLEPVDGGKKTKATYWVYTSPGGSIPTFIANAANNTAVPNLYEAVRNRLAATTTTK